jgi:TRAP-type C4-dicarboxylate transport system permease small subunit
MINGMVIFAGILLIFSMLSISAEVVSRYLFGYPFGWVTEICEYSLVYITFLVAAWVLRQERHIKMDLIFNRLSLKLQSTLNILTSLVSAMACFVIFLFSLRVTWELFKTGYFTPTVLEIPKFIIMAIIFIGSLTLFFQLLIRTFNFIYNKKRIKSQK